MCQRWLPGLQRTPSLKCLNLWNVLLDSEPALDAVVTLAMSQLQHLTLFHSIATSRQLRCQVPASLTRMLDSR